MGGASGSGDMGGPEGLQIEKSAPIVAFTRPTGPMPNWMTEGGTLAEEEDMAREEIRRTMRNNIQPPDFNNTPLRNVLHVWSTEAKVPILIDHVALETSGVSPEDPVTLNGLPALSLQRALRLILDPKELTYIVEPESILITTKEAGSARTMRTYDLAYLLPTSEKVVDLLTIIRTIVPANWDVDGGENTLQSFGSMMIASCPEEVHAQIEGLLYALSKMNRENF